MFKLLFLFIFLIFLSEAANPGVKIVLTQKALDYAAKKAVDILAKEVPKIKIASVSGKKKVRYQLKSLRVSYFTKPTASVKINPGSGLTIKLKRGGLRIDGSWGAKVLFWIRSKVYATSSEIDLELGVGIREVNGKPVLKTKSCRANLGKFKVRTKGSILSWLFNIIAKLFKNQLTRKFEKKFCKILTKVVNKDANDELSTFNLIAKINNDIHIDYHMTQQPTFHSKYMALSLKGKFLFDPVSSFSPAPMGWTLGRMVSTSISQDTLNSLGRVLHSRKLFNFRFTVTDKIFEKLGKNLNIKKFKINTHVYSTSAPIVSISPSKLTVKVAVDAEFLVPKLVLRLGVGVEATCTVKAEGDKIKGKVTDIKLDVTVKYNGIGEDMTDEELNEFANGVVPFLLPIINKKLDEGIPLPKIKNVILSNYLLNLSYKQIHIACNIQGFSQPSVPKTNIQGGYQNLCLMHQRETFRGRLSNHLC